MNKLNNLQIELIATGNDVRVSTLEIARHISPGSKAKNKTNINKKILGLIHKYLDGFNELGLVYFQSLARLEGQHGGGDTEYVLLNEPQTNLLFMSMRNSNPLVWQFKVKLAKRFEEMKQLLVQRSNAEWLAYRESGKIITKRLNELFTTVLDEVGKSHNKYRYINLQQAIYKATLGKTCKQLRAERNIPKHHTIRDYLNSKELEKISLLQSITELTLQQYKHVTDAMIITAVVNSGYMLNTAINCPLIIELTH